MGFLSPGGLIGILLLLISGAILWSKTEGIGARAIRSFIERRFLGGRDLHDPNARYAKDVTLLGLPLLVTALTTIIPMTTVMFDAKLLLLYGAIYLVITIGYWLYQGGKHAVRWLKASADVAEYKSAKLKPTPTGDQS
jgi:hypothetical protein